MKKNILIALSALGMISVVAGGFAVYHYFVKLHEDITLVEAD